MPSRPVREATVHRSLQTDHHRATDPPCPLGMGGAEGGAAATRPQPGVPGAYRRWRWLRHVPDSTWLCSELRRGFGPPLVPASDAPEGVRRPDRTPHYGLREEEVGAGGGGHLYHLPTTPPPREAAPFTSEKRTGRGASGSVQCTKRGQVRGCSGGGAGPGARGPHLRVRGPGSPEPQTPAGRSRQQRRVPPAVPAQAVKCGQAPPPPGARGQVRARPSARPPAPANRRSRRGPEVAPRNLGVAGAPKPGRYRNKRRKSASL